jgi:hypothetical protein
MNIKRSLRVSFLGISLLLFSPALLFGQSEKGALVGTVTDSNGAVEGELEVTLKPLRSAVGQASQWVDLCSRGRTVSSKADRALKIKVPAGGFRALEFRR